MTEIAMMSALAVILSFMKFDAAWAYGGSVSLEMLPIVLFAFRRGLGLGLLMGLVYGILDVIINPSVVHFVQLILDYPLAFMVVGFAGIFKVKAENSLRKNIMTIIFATALGSGLRLVCHFFSGVIWFGSYAPEGTPVAVYSLVYNIGYMVPSFILIAFVLSLLIKSAPNMFERI